MEAIEEIIQRVQKIEHGFLDIQKAADEVIAAYPPDECLSVAENLYTSQKYQVRSLAAFILGQLAAASEESLSFLKQSVSRDPDWRVQEILAKAFDQYCADLGYEQALPAIWEWLADPSPNIRRAVTEGLRIWTGRPYFREHPEVAVQILSRLRDDQSEYVRKSVGNALRDISKKHGDLVLNQLQQWDISNKKVAQTYRLASRFLEKKGRN